jgi:hypothetical protein
MPAHAIENLGGRCQANYDQQALILA